MTLTLLRSVLLRVFQNPQNDMQAQARAHRIGQKQEVKVYRLITSKTYEMEMFRRASLKLGLDQAVLRKMQVNEGRAVQYGQVDSSLSRLSQMDKKEVESLLKFGAYDLFNEAADAASQSFCLSEDMQLLTDRGFMSRAEVFAACPELCMAATPPSTTRSLRSSSSSSESPTSFDRSISAASTDSMDNASGAEMGEPVGEEEEGTIDAARPRRAASSAPLRFASFDPATGHLVYLAATALTVKTVTSLVEFTHVAEAPHWAADADEYGLTPGQAAQMQAASDRARDGEEAVDRVIVEHTSNGLSLLVDAHHDMFVRVGMSADDAGNVPNTVWASTDYHKVKAGSLLSGDVRQRVKMLGQAKAGLAASDAEDLPLASMFGLMTEDEVTALLLLYGYWLGNGRPEVNHRWVRFCPKQAGDKEWVLGHLATLGLTEQSGGVRSSMAQGQVAFDVRDRRWTDYFFGEYAVGQVASDLKSLEGLGQWVWRLRAERARLVLAGLRFANGSDSSHVNDIVTSGCHFRDEIVRLCLHAGYSARFSLLYKEGDWRPGTGTDVGVPIQSWADAWMVSYNDDAQAAEPVLRNLRDIRRHSVPRGVQVWCPTVPPHSLIIARRVRKNDKGVVTQASRPIVVGNCEEDIDQILSKRTTVVTQQPVDDGDDEDGEAADEDGAENGDEAALERRQRKRKRDAGSTFSKANFTSSTSDSAVDLHATDFWERVIPDQKSATKMQRRLESASVFVDEASRQSFLSDLFELVQEVIGMRQQGVEATNAAEVLDVLMKMTEMGGNGEFTDDERLQASEWMLEIEKPKRQRRTMERWADITSPAALAEVNGLDVSDLRTSGDWSRAGEGAKRRKLKASGRQYTRRERKAMIVAVTTLAGLCPTTQPPVRATLEPPIPDVWQAVHTMSGLIDRPFDDFAAFSLAFLAYCVHVGDQEDSAVFRLARQRLIAALPPPAAVKEESKEAEAEEEMKDVTAAIEEDAGAEGREGKNPMASPSISTPSSSPAPAMDDSIFPASLSPSRDMLPPAAIRSQTTTTSLPSSAPPPPPVPVRSSSTALTGSERQSRQGRSAGSSSRARPSLPSSSLDPRTASYHDFPSMSADKQFHKHVMKRVKKWSRYMAIQQLVQRELELHLGDRDKAATLKVENLADVTADSDLDDSSDDEGEELDSLDSSDSEEDAAGASANPIKGAMTVRSRGKKWKRESMRDQQRRVKEEGRKRKAGEERLKGNEALLVRLQQRFGALYDLSIPTKVDRSPAWWWTAADDKALMVGVSRHGTDFYDIETDPLLGFTRRLCDEPPEPNDADYDPFVDGVRPSTTADGEGLPLTSPALNANGSSGGSSASLSCICNQPRYGRATKGTTKVCGRCHHFFHLDCLDQRREDNSLRAEQFPPMPPDGFQRLQPPKDAEAKDGEEPLVKKEGKERSEEAAAADDRMDDDSRDAVAVKMEVDEDGGRPSRSKRTGAAPKPRGTLAEPSKTRGRGSKGAVNASVDLTQADVADDAGRAGLDSPAMKALDAKGDEDDEDEDERPAGSAARSFANAGWLCDRCEMTFPSDRALELRLRSLLEAFDRDRQSLLRLADRSERAKVEKREKRQKAEAVSSVWTKKERTRFQRAIQMYGSSDTALGMMRRKMGLKNKSEATLRQHCDRCIAQCRLLVAAARREQDIAIYVGSKKELKVRGEELRLLQLRVDRLVEREKDVERRKEDRRKKGAAADDSEEEDLSGYCFCDGRVDDQFMVCCDALLPGCKEWYHGQCVGITQSTLPSTWFCPHCTREKAKVEGRDATGTVETRPELQTAISLQVHPPSPVSAHVLSHSVTAPTPQQPSSAHSSAPTSASAHSAFTFPPPAPAAPTFDPTMVSQAYVAQPYASYPQQQQPQDLHYHYQHQQQQQMGMQAQAPMYGHPSGYNLVGMSPASAPPGMYATTYMFPQQYSHPLQQMGSQPAMYLSNGQQVMMQPMQPVDMMGYYYSQPYGQPHPQMMYPAQYAPMGVHVSQPQSIGHSQPSSAFSAPVPPPAPVVPLSAQPSPVQPLQPPAAPVQPLAPPIVEVTPTSPPALPLAPATSSKPPSPLVAKVSNSTTAGASKLPTSSKSSESRERRRREEEKRPSQSPDKAKVMPAPAKAVVATSVPSPSPPVPTFVATSSQSLAPGDAVPRAAAWKVRRQLYSTSAAVMALQMQKLLAEQQREVAKLAEWKRQRIDLTDAATSSTPSPSASNPNPTLEGDDRISLHLAYKVLSRVLLLDYLRATAQRWSDGEWKERLVDCPSSAMPKWWQPELHDWSTWKGVLEHGLGMIDDVLADPSLTPAWTAAIQGEKKEKRDGKAFLNSFLRDKGPLLRRLHSVCNWAVHKGAAKESAEDDWLEWLLTSKRELKSAAFRVNHNVGAYNATSSHTLKALAEATRGQDDEKDGSASNSPLDGSQRTTALLSIQSISNWARIKESTLRLQPASTTAIGSSSGGPSASRSKKDDASSGDDDGRRRSLKTSPKDKSRGGSRSPSSQSLDDEERRKRRRQRKHRPSSRSRSGRGSDSGRRSKRPSSRSHRPSFSSSSRVSQVRPKTLPKVPPRDAQNRPILPLPIRGGITITSLGRIVTDRILYHTNSTIYPVGFTSQRSYYSLKTPNTKVMWTSRIDDGGVSPLFVVTPADDPETPVINRTASGAWGEVIRKVHRLKGKGHLKVTQSGPMIFGVANSLIKQLVGEMEGADIIRRRWEKAKEEGRTESLGEDEEMKDGREVDPLRAGEQRRKERADGGLMGREDEDEGDEYSDSADSRSGSDSGSDSRSSDSDGSASDSDDGDSGSGSGSDSSDSRRSNSSDDDGGGRHAGREGGRSSSFHRHSADDRSARQQKTGSGGNKRRR